MDKNADGDALNPEPEEGGCGVEARDYSAMYTSRRDRELDAALEESVAKAIREMTPEKPESYFQKFRDMIRMAS